MADQKEVNELEWAGRLEKIVTGGLGLLTLLYLGGIVYLFGCDVWGLTQNNRMGEAGDFIAGFTTPVVFLWLIYGYFLQRRELGLQRNELKKTGEALVTQVKIMEDRDEADRQRSMPRFCLKKNDSPPVLVAEDGDTYKSDSPDPNDFILRNTGGPARNLEITICPDGRGWSFPPPLLDKGETCPVHISNPFWPRLPDLLNPDTADQPPADQPTSCRVRFVTSERSERLEQRWSIRFTGKYSYVEIKPTTEGPIPAG